MALKVAINGFGRIGRAVLRAIVENNRTDLQVVAVNDLAPPATNVHLLKYDSVHGRFKGQIKFEGDTVDVGHGPIKLLAERSLDNLPWKDMGIDLVLECTGIFASKEKASGHIRAGAKRVLVSAPADGADLTVVYGVNQDRLSPEMQVISNASCTTNCLAPVAKVLNDGVGIERGHMTTIHSYTNDQHLLDVFHKDLHRARAAALSQIPTSTGAAKAVGLVLPELKGKLDGVAIRVPTPNVSLVDLTFVPKRETTVEEIQGLIKTAAEGSLKGILDYHEEPLVSIDFNHAPVSSTVDLKNIKVLEGKLVRVSSWYDNEWGFSNRMVDTSVAIGKL
ncbi:glyceraldehyde-3-phosphate dehydrogenase (NAD+) [Arboricoccus pini]|uniref:Glyceraldehyde-3-phosphate dehydrogenase n=1 Tax=Arboricoccus pini TaxID=1963835 RepID=A0A212PXA5_9PROT|nr:type I glyceraldehyde-3-phosphate dehydrogenase [Arboricoccus pini]SNB51627.1 glyceraldehyde-3-phosphate dehydrogenase (NAD+) [Arboricoccus pini]